MIRKASAKAVVVWRLRLFGLAMVPSFFCALLLGFGSRAFLIATSFWVTLLLGSAYLYLPMALKNFSYQIQEQALVVTSGVFFWQTRMIRLSNIQFVTVRQSPLQTLLGTATVVVCAAGGSLFLPDLEKREALCVKQFLSGIEE